MVTCSKIKDLNLVFSHGCKSTPIERIKLDIMNLFALIFHGDNSLLVETLTCITKLNLVLSGINQFKLTLWEPCNRIDIISNILEGLVAIGNNLGAFSCLDFAQGHKVSLQVDITSWTVLMMWSNAKKLLLIFNFDTIEILVHVLLDIPDHQTGIIHAGMVISRCKNPGIDWIPRQRHTVSRVLDHAACHKDFLYLGGAHRLRELPLLAVHWILSSCIDQRYLAVLVCCQNILIP